MQLKRSIAILAAAAALVLAAPLWAQSTSTLLQEGIFVEETIGDLDAAIEIYQKIVAGAEKNRTYAALAQYRLGMCYLKKGQKQDAAVAFRKLVDQFPMQTERVAQAKVQLSALGKPISAMVTRQVWAPALDTLGGVSPDGRYLSYVHWDTGNLGLRDLSTGENRHLTNKGSWADSEEFAQHSRVSPDGKQVAYAWFNEEFYELRIVGLDGSEQRVVYTNEEVFYIQPAGWSPDGKHILAIFSKKDGTNQIVLVSSANGSVRVLKTLDWRYPLNMSISPDGRYVVYDPQPEENSPQRDIFLLAIDGSRDIPLIVHAAVDLFPVWAPDGNRIVFGSDRTGAMGLWTLPVVDGQPQGSPELLKKDMGRFNPIGFTGNGSFYYSVESGIPDVHTATLDLGTGKFLTPATSVTQRFVGTNIAPDWSSDGKYLLYLSQRGVSPFGVGSRVLVIRSLESGEERILSPQLAFNRRLSLPRWSPDGRSILVAGNDVKGRQGCYRIDAQTGEVTAVVQRKSESGGRIRRPAWLADGKSILYERGGSLVVRDLESGQEKVLHNCEHIHAWALSPDGRQVALSVPSKDQVNRIFNSNVLLVMPTTGGEKRELFRVPSAEEITAIAWTPDGRQLLFGRISGPPVEEGLWRISAEGGEPQVLALDLTGDQLNSLRFHPDGKRIAFIAGERTQDVWVMENFLPEPKVAAASGTVTRQVWAPALDNMGAPSPDGRYLSYVNWTKGNLAVHDFKTGEDRDLTDEGTWELPNQFCDVSIWSPDSRQIAYYWFDRGGETGLRIVGLDGSKPRVLSSSSLELGPGVPSAPWPRAWSKDGKYILALQGKKDKSQVGHEDHIVLVSVADGSVRTLKSLGAEHSERHSKNMSLSPDGRYVVYELGEKHGSTKRDIHLLATDGSGDMPLVEHPADDWAPYWTPDGKRMVFLSDRSGSTGMWMLEVKDGTPTGPPTQIKETGSTFYPMGFTRDGSFYYGIGNAASDIYLATIDFEAGTVLTSPTKTSLRFEGTNHAPIWSPDGKFLAYASQRDGRQSYLLVIRSVETGEERDLSPATLDVTAAHAWGAPQWSPDGRSILVAGVAEGSRSLNYGLHLVDVQTGDFTTIVQDERGTNQWESGPRWPVFSKDGTHVYYMRDRSIMALSLETQRESELYRTNSYIAWLACSPDGRLLAFFERSQAGRPAVLKTIRVSGGEPRELLTLQKGQRLFWSVGISWTPDGRYVVIGAPDVPDETNDLWIIPAAGGEPRVLNLGGNTMQLSLHPDGRRIALVRREPGGSHEVWVMENFLPLDKSVSHN